MLYLFGDYVRIELLIKFLVFFGCVNKMKLFYDFLKDFYLGLKYFGFVIYYMLLRL